MFDCRMYARYPTTGGFGGGRGRGRGRGDWSGSPSTSYGDGYNNGYRNNPRHKRFNDKYEGYNREAIGRREAPPPLDKEVSEGSNNSLHPTPSTPSSPSSSLSSSLLVDYLSTLISSLSLSLSLSPHAHLLTPRPQRYPDRQTAVAR